MSHVDEGTLHAYLDGELTAVERAGTEAHLSACAPCRARLDEARALVERAQGLLARAAPPEVATPPFPGAVPTPRPVRPLPRWLPLAWAASVLLALGGGYLARGGVPTDGSDAVRQLMENAAPAAPAADEMVAPTPAAREATLPAASGRGRAAVADVPAAAKAESRDAANAQAIAAEPAVAADAVAPAPAAAQRPQAVGAASTLVSGAVVATAPARLELPAARRVLDAEVYGIADLPVAAIRSPDSVTVIVEQRDGAVLVRLFQRRVGDDTAAAPAPAEGERAARARPDATDRLARYVGMLRIEIEGPLAADSLSRLLERLVPLRP